MHTQGCTAPASDAHTTRGCSLRHLWLQVRDEASPSGQRMVLTPYLSSRELRSWLGRFGEELPGLRERARAQGGTNANATGGGGGAGRRGSHGSHESELVLPAFVYSLAEPMMLLLDRLHQVSTA